MDFIVYRRRVRGRPRNGTVLSGPTVRGAFVLRDERVDDFNRLCRVARLVGPELQALHDPPPLYDATLLFAKPDLWSVGGYELVDTNGIMCSYAQTWFMIPGAIHDQERREVAERERLIQRVP